MFFLRKFRDFPTNPMRAHPDTQLQVHFYLLLHYHRNIVLSLLLYYYAGKSCAIFRYYAMSMLPIIHHYIFQ